MMKSESMRKDLLYAFRTLAKSPGFTAAAILSLALGIGANTAIFGVIRATLLDAVPYADPGRVALLYTAVPHTDFRDFPVSAPDFLDWRARNTVFQSMGALHVRGVNLAGAGEPERVRAARATSGWFETLGMKPVLGRPLTPEEDRHGGSVAVISYEFWKAHLGGGRGVLGRTILIDGAAHTIVGVMPPDSTFGTIALWRPLTFTEEPWMKVRGSHNLTVVARTKPGVSLAQARQELTSIAQRLAEQYPDDNAGFGVTLWPIGEHTVRNVRPALLVLFGSVCLVLLIACGNAANLLLARAHGRRREIAIREALGASRWRILRLTLAESCLLSLAAALAGSLLALWGVAGLVRLIPQGLLPNAGSIAVDGPVLAFALGISILCGMGFGAGPGWITARQDGSRNLREGGRGGAPGTVRRRVRFALAVGEIGLSLVLLIGAGLLLKSFWRLLNVNPGFRAGGILTAGIVPTAAWTPQAWRRNLPLYREILDRVSGLRGVERAAFTTTLPLEGHNEYDSFEIEGRPYRHLTDLPVADQTTVTPDYFATMGIPLLQGRGFTPADTETAPLVALADEALVRQYWPGQNPVGKRIRYLDSRGPGPWRTIIGIAGAVKHLALNAPATGTVYLPLEQNPYPGLMLALRTAGDPAALGPAVRAIIHEIAPDLPVVGMRPMRRILDDTMWRQRLAAQLVGLFAAMAVVLALVGACGVILYSVSQRRNEFGIRMALGASRLDVLRLVLREAAWMAGAGIAIGLVAAAASGRALGSLLYEVETTDAATYAACALLMLAAALAASYLPARRATKVDPIEALRCE